MIRSLRTIFCCSLTLVAFAALASSASALDLCVGAGSACDQTFEYSEAGFNDAINAYYGSDSAPDNIFVAAGTINFTSFLSLEDSPASGEVRIRGAGSGKTKLVFDGVSSEAVHLDYSEGSEINGLMIERTGDVDASRIGLILHGGFAEDIYVFMPPGEDYTAFRFGSGSTRCIGCRAKVSGQSSTGFFVEDGGDAYIEGGKAEAYDVDSEVHTRGVRVENESARVELSRTLIKNFNRGVFQYRGMVSARDTIIELGDQEDAKGFSLDVASVVDDDYETRLDGVTVHGTGISQSGIELQSNTEGLGDIEVETDDSLFWLTGAGSDALFCNRATGVDKLPVDFLIDYSLAPSVTDNGCGIDQENMVTGTATFLDAASGDYRPAPDSVVIDAGDPASAEPGRFDFYGATRYVNGADFNFAGNIDLGAAEYQNYAPNKPEATASPATVVAGSPVTFSASGSDPNGQAVSFTWEFGEGESATGATVSRTYAVPGIYKAKAIASDGELTRASAWVEVTVVAAPPAPSIVLGKPTAKFKYGKKKSKRFAVGTATSKPRIPVTTNFAGEFTLTLAKIKGGWTSGSKCVAKKPKKGKPKRCNLALKGSQKLTLPAGASFLTFGGKWGRGALPTGKYLLTVSGGGAKHDIALNAVRNLKG